MGPKGAVLLLKSCQSDGWTEKRKCRAHFFLVMPIALAVLRREDRKFESDDADCRVLWTAFHLEGRDAASIDVSVHLHLFIYKRTRQSRGRTQAEGRGPPASFVIPAALPGPPNVRASVGGHPSALNPGRRQWAHSTLVRVVSTHPLRIASKKLSRRVGRDPRLRLQIF